MTHRYRIQEVINGPEPDPEYHECGRCGIRLKPTSLLTECEDCKGLNAYKASPSQQRFGSANFLPVDPAYEVSLHFPTINAARDDPTVATLSTMRIPHFSYYASRDRLEFDYAKGLIDAEGERIHYPIVLISSRGEYIKHWTGFNLSELNRIPAARRAATGEQEAIQASVPTTREEQAA